MAGYTRNDTSNNIADGNVINASDLDGEFDALVAAFDAATGHTHDGTAANGAPITKVGPAQDLVVSTGAITPKTDNTVDLGSSSYEFKDLYIDGTANIDSLVADTADINGGTIDGATINGSTNTITNVSLTTAVTGTLPVANGGTGASSLTANNVILGNGTSAVQVVAPSTAGNVLTSDGTTWASAALPAGGIEYVYKTSTYTATDKQGVLANTTGAAFTVTLPASPATGAQVVIADAGGSWGTNHLTIGRNSSTIEGLAENLVCDISGISVQLVYSGSTWEVYAQVGSIGGDAVTLTGTQTLTNKTITYADNTLTGVVGTTATQTLTNKTLTDPAIIGTILEDVYTISDGAAFEIDPGNGSVQLITLGASRTPKATNFAAGESVLLMVDDGSAYTLTWTDSTFGGSGVVWKTDGGVAPTLNTSGYTAIVLWKVSTQVYGARVGDA